MHVTCKRKFWVSVGNRFFFFFLYKFFNGLFLCYGNKNIFIFMIYTLSIDDTLCVSRLPRLGKIEACLHAKGVV